MGNGRVLEPDLGLIRAVRAAGGDTVNKCYQCATCSVVCNLTPDDKPFPRKEMLMAGWGRKDDLMKNPDLWMCYQCNDCTTHCPREARPGDVLAAARSYIYQSFAFPSFMGKALASPKAFPVLLLLPVLILLAAIFVVPKVGPDGQALYLTSSNIDFDYFLRHSFVDALFVLGNVIIFIFAAVGFLRFWKALKSNEYKSNISFVSAMIKVVTEIFKHSNFKECETNKSRYIGHMMVFFGFIGAMITTGAVFILIFAPHYLQLLGLEQFEAYFRLPINLPNPIKFIGAFSGIALVVGSYMLILRRWQNRDEVGANGYPDYLFLYMLFFVGFTGMLSWLTRLIGIPWIAYANYFLHIVTVFFLLWYMPYSKFAHMIYRTLALVYAKSVGREPKQVV